MKSQDFHPRNQAFFRDYEELQDGIPLLLYPREDIGDIPERHGCHRAGDEPEPFSDFGSFVIDRQTAISKARVMKQITIPLRLLVTGILLAAFSPCSLSAQFHDTPPVQSAFNPSLRAIKAGFIIESLSDRGGAAWVSWSSSFLPAEGTPPAKPELSGDEESDMEASYTWSDKYAAWSAMYSPASLRDENPGTAWVEGVKGNGIGEVAIVRVDLPGPVKIRSGFQRSASLFAKNARPRMVRLWILESTSYGATETGYVYSQVRALSSKDIELKDVMGWQALVLPNYTTSPASKKAAEPHGGVVATFLAVQILSVYPGSAYEDCCISDIASGSP